MRERLGRFLHRNQARPRVLRGLALAALGLVVVALGGLELWYRSLLPRELPTASGMPQPRLVHEMLWLHECRGHGTPYLRPIHPFLLGPVLFARDRADACLATSVARLLTASSSKPERHLRRTVREAALATWVSRHWTAEQALDTFAAEVWMGQGVHGLRDAAGVYFGKPLESLDVAEFALLVAMIRSPTALSPLCHPERARAARDEVLRSLAEAGWLDRQGLSEASARGLGVQGLCPPSP